MPTLTTLWLSNVLISNRQATRKGRPLIDWTALTGPLCSLGGRVGKKNPYHMPASHRLHPCLSLRVKWPLTFKCAWLFSLYGLTEQSTVLKFHAGHLCVQFRFANLSPTDCPYPTIRAVRDYEALGDKRQCCPHNNLFTCILKGFRYSLHVCLSSEESFQQFSEMLHMFKAWLLHYCWCQTTWTKNMHNLVFVCFCLVVPLNKKKQHCPKYYD